MYLQTFRAAILTAVVVLGVGCPPSAGDPVDAGGSGGTSGSGGSSGTGGSSGGDAATAVTYTKDIQPIFMAKCAPCHTGQTIANHNIGSAYADVNKPVESFDFGVCWKDTEQTMPKKVGECALLLIDNGQMPYQAGCGGATPLKPEACLSAAQKATVAAWVAAGMPQ